MTFIASRRLALLPLLFLLLFLSSCPADTVSAATSIARPKHHVNWRTFLKQTAPNSLLRGAQLTDLTALLQISASEGGQLAYTTSEASGNEAGDATFDEYFRREEVGHGEPEMRRDNGHRGLPGVLKTGIPMRGGNSPKRMYKDMDGLTSWGRERYRHWRKGRPNTKGKWWPTPCTSYPFCNYNPPPLPVTPPPWDIPARMPNPTYPSLAYFPHILYGNKEWKDPCSGHGVWNPWIGKCHCCNCKLHQHRTSGACKWPCQPKCMLPCEKIFNEKIQEFKGKKCDSIENPVEEYD